MQWLAKFIYFKVLGWHVTGNTNISKNTIKKAVIIAVPHTSWHDFYIGILLRAVLNVKTNFVGKKELFIFPFGYFFKALGGAPINRKSNENKVSAIGKLFLGKLCFKYLKMIILTNYALKTGFSKGLFFEDLWI